MDYKTAMANVDDGQSVERTGWPQEKAYHPNGASDSYWVALIHGQRQRLISTLVLGPYTPTAEDLAATDWEVTDWEVI